MAHQDALRLILAPDSPTLVALENAAAKEKRGGCRGCRRGRMYQSVGNAVAQDAQREEIMALLAKLE
jgi:hypothetical protein